MGDPRTVPRKEHYSQVCVWPDTYLDNDDESQDIRVQLFEDHMDHAFDIRVQFLEEFMTSDDPPRFALIFAVHHDDLAKFALPRLSCGIRWVEDATDTLNRGGFNYPERIREYRSWSA